MPNRIKAITYDGSDDSKMKVTSMFGLEWIRSLYTDDIGSLIINFYGGDLLPIHIGDMVRENTVENRFPEILSVKSFR